MKLITYLFIAFLTISDTGAQSTTNVPRRTLIVMFDGLRPDYITQENMPYLFKLKKEGVYGNDNHSVFPTVTRVNSSSYATGSYPQTHGILGNTVYFPEVDKLKGLNTGEAANLIKINEATGGKLLLTASLGEVLHAHGKKLMVFSSGSSGQAYLQNHKVNGGAIFNTELILPDSIKDRVIQELGAQPAYAKPNTARHIWVTNAFLKYGLVNNGPEVSAIWYSDPDATAHAEGIGSPKTLESIKIVDAQLGRVLDSIQKIKTYEFDIIISTDHGFVTEIGKENLIDLLIREGIVKDKDSDEVIISGSALYLKDKSQENVKKIVAILQKNEWIGAIFTNSRKDGELKGAIPGTLSFESVHWNNKGRTPEILVDNNWNDASNQYGYKGSSLSLGIASHGASSPYEIHIPLIVLGPSFRKIFESNIPTSNVDITPTVLHLQGIPVPKEMDGRVMKELLKENANKPLPALKKNIVKVSNKDKWGTYTLELNRTLFENKSYVNFTKVTRILKK